MLGRAPSIERGSLPAQAGARLARRRRTRRRRAFIALLVLLLLLLTAAIYGLQQSAVRISHVEIIGSDYPLENIATVVMQGSYLGIIPRDSVFFFPASRIRAAIIDAHPGIAAVSLFRNGLTGISIKTDERTPIARWCGLAPTEGVEEYCYVFDASGYVFAALATTTETINSFSLYAPLVGETLEPLPAGRQGLRATLAQADALPGAFDFARELTTLGAPVTRVILRGDEVDDMLVSGTRVTYVLGNEQNAFTALVSARGNLNLSDGSVEYVDLRFDGKVYVKRR